MAMNNQSLTASSVTTAPIGNCSFLTRTLKNPPPCKNFVLPGCRVCKFCEKQMAKEHALVEERRRQGFCKNLWCNNETRGHAACSKCYFEENPHLKPEAKAAIVNECSAHECSEAALLNGRCPKHQPEKREEKPVVVTAPKPAGKPSVKLGLCPGCNINDRPAPGEMCRMCAPPKVAAKALQAIAKPAPVPEILKCGNCRTYEPTPGHKRCKRCYIRWCIESGHGVAFWDRQTVEYIDVLQVLGQISKEVADNLRQQLAMPAVATPAVSTPTAKVTQTPRQKFEQEVKATFARVGYNVATLREAYKQATITVSNGCVLFVATVGSEKFSFSLYPPKKSPQKR